MLQLLVFGYGLPSLLHHTPPVALPSLVIAVIFVFRCPNTRSKTSWHAQHCQSCEEVISTDGRTNTSTWLPKCPHKVRKETAARPDTPASPHMLSLTALHMNFPGKLDYHTEKLGSHSKRETDYLPRFWRYVPCTPRAYF
jgi:hypothetical protein